MVPAEESALNLPTCVAGIVQLLLLLAMTSWGLWVARRHGKRPFWVAAAAAPIVSITLWLVGILVAVYMLIRAFGTLTFAPPAERAQRLSEGISDTMTVSAIFLVPATLLLLGSLVAFTVGTFMRPKPSEQRVEKGTPE